MDEFQVEEDDLENIFDILMLCGAGQLVNGYFVAAECLVQPETLRWLLSYYKDNTFSVEDLDHYGSMFFVTDQLINYYIHI